MTSDRVASARSELRLLPAETMYSQIDGNRTAQIAVPFLDYVLDGTSLRELLREAGHGDDLVTGLCRAWPAAVAPTVQDLLGNGSNRSADVEMLVCKVCGDRNCGALLAVVTVGDDCVTWHNWRFTTFNGTVDVEGLAAYTFDRHVYEAEVLAAPAAVAHLAYDEQHDRARRRFLWPWQWGWRTPSGR